MTRYRFRSALAVSFTLVFAAAGHADDEEKSGAEDGAGNVGREVGEPSAGLSRVDFALRSRGAAALPSAAAQGFSVSSGRQMELFGRLGLSSVNVTAEDSFGIVAAMASDMASLSASRRVSEFGWGVGARLMSGSWGMEGTYNVFDSLALSPGWLVADETAAGELTTGFLDLPVVASKADVVVGQVIRGIRLSRTTELFVGLGAGWMRATDSSTDRLLSGAGFPDLEEITGELPPDIPPEFVAAFVPEVEFNANRSSIVFAGSLGLSFRAGRILLRPRVDVIIARALTTELTVGFPGLADLGLPETDEFGRAEFSYTTSVTRGSTSFRWTWVCRTDREGPDRGPRRGRRVRPAGPSEREDVAPGVAGAAAGARFGCQRHRGCATRPTPVRSAGGGRSVVEAIG